MVRWKQLLLLVWLMQPACSGQSTIPAKTTRTEPVEPVYEGKLLHDWIETLRAGNADVRLGAALRLEEIGPDAKPAVPQLIEALKDDDTRVRQCAASALGAIGPEAKAAVPHLAAMLPEEDCGSEAGYALGKIGEPALPALLEALKGEDGEARLHAAAALGDMGPKAKAAVPLLIARLMDSHEHMRFCVARVLGKIGPDARAAENPLRDALEDKDPKVRVAAMFALARINPEYTRTAVPALLAILRDKANPARHQAIIALGDLGPKAKSAVEPLLALLKDKKQSGVDRDIIIRALGRIGPDAKAAVPDLILVLKGNDPCSRMSAAEALGQIGPDAKSAVPILLDMLKSEFNHRDAAKALRRIDPEAARLREAQSSTSPNKVK